MMVIVEHISAGDDEKLERVFDSIRRFFKNSLKKSETLEVQWGTEKAFEELDKTVLKGLRALAPKEES